MTFKTKIELTFDRKSSPPDNDTQFYRVYRKRGAVPDRLPSELVFIISQPFFPENLQDTIIRKDSQLPQTGISYDPLEQINEIDPRGVSFKIAIDASVPVPPTNVFVIPDPADNSSDIGGILIGWTAAVAVGLEWGYDVTAVDSGGLESPEGAFLDPLETSKIETINIGLADGVTPVPSEYPQVGQIFSTYLVEGGSVNFFVNNLTSIIDNNNSQGFDTDGPKGVTGHSAMGDFPDQTATLRWTEGLKTQGTNLSSRQFTVTAFTRAGYSSQSATVPGPSSVICPITNGVAGLTITRLDATRWHNGIALKTDPSPPPEILTAPLSLDGVINLNHGSIIRGSVFLTDTSGSTVYIEDSGTYNSPNNDGDYLIDYSRINGATDIGGRIKILNSGIISPGQILHIQYKFGLNWTAVHPLITSPIVGPYNGTVWSGAGPQEYTDTTVDNMSAYNYAWFVTDNAGRTTQGIEIKYAQAIIQDIVFPSAITNFFVEAILEP